MKIAFFVLSMIATALATLGVVTWSQLRQEVITLESHVAALEAREQAAGVATAEVQWVKAETVRQKEVDVAMNELVGRSLGTVQDEVRALRRLVSPEPVGR